MSGAEVQHEQHEQDEHDETDAREVSGAEVIMTSDTTTDDDDEHTLESKVQTPPNLRASDDADEQAGTDAGDTLETPGGISQTPTTRTKTGVEANFSGRHTPASDFPATPPASTSWAPEATADQATYDPEANGPSNLRASGRLSEPTGLDVDGAALWQSITAKYALRPDEVPLLEAYARAVDDLALLRKALAEAGSLIVAGSKGQARVHPVMAEIRAHAGLCARLASQLGLPDDDGERVGATPASRKAIRAANSRWLRDGPRLIEGAGNGDT